MHFGDIVIFFSVLHNVDDHDEDKISLLLTYEIYATHFATASSFAATSTRLSSYNGAIGCIDLQWRRLFYKKLF